MIGRLLVRYAWRPFEERARRTPFWPLRSMVDEPVPGVVRVRIGNAVTRGLSRLAGGYDYAVCYVVRDSVMIDTGFPWAARELRRLVTGRGWDRTLRLVVNTHYHEDHVGNNDVLAAMTGARFVGSAETAAALRLPAEPRWYRRFLFGPPPPAVRVEASPPGPLNQDGIGLHLVATPGHCPGHLCVLLPEEGWLFGGDLFVAPDLDAQLPDVDGPDWVRSLDAVLALPRVTALFDAHGTVLLGEEAVRTALTGKRNFLSAIARRVREQLDGASTLEELTARVFAPRGSLDEWLAQGDGRLSLLTGSEFSRRHLVASFARPLLAADPV